MKNIGDEIVLLIFIQVNERMSGLFSLIYNQILAYIVQGNGFLIKIQENECLKGWM